MQGFFSQICKKINIFGKMVKKLALPMGIEPMLPE